MTSNNKVSSLKQAALNELEIIDRPASPSLLDLLGYWQRKCRPDGLPRRADIDPIDIPSHLGDIFMLDVLDGGADFRYRLIGTRVVDGMGRNATGRKVSDFYRRHPVAIERLCDLFRRPVIERRPIFARGRIFWLPAQNIRHFEAGYLPLADANGDVTIVLAEIFVIWPGSHS